MTPEAQGRGRRSERGSGFFDDLPTLLLAVAIALVIGGAAAHSLQALGY